MRADRLISLLMLLNSRGKMTAEDLAGELEVSVRTVYRDLDALSTAGIPVYAGRGPGGGCALLETYRASLAALTREELRSLFLISIPEPLLALGMGPVLRTAFHKLLAAAPGPAAGGQVPPARIYLDWAGGGQVSAAPLLPVVYQALEAGQRLFIHYRLWNLAEIDQVVDPYGLVARAGEWHLVFCANGKVRAWPVAGLLAARPVAEAVSLPPGFNLAGEWQRLRSQVEAGAGRFSARLRAAPAAVPALARRFGAWVEQAPAAADGWRVLDLPYQSFYAARDHLLGLGAAVEVLAPPMLRRSLADHALQIVKLYGAS